VGGGASLVLERSLLLRAFCSSPRSRSRSSTLCERTVFLEKACALKPGLVVVAAMKTLARRRSDNLAGRHGRQGGSSASRSSAWSPACWRDGIVPDPAGRRRLPVHSSEGQGTSTSRGWPGPAKRANARWRWWPGGESLPWFPSAGRGESGRPIAWHRRSSPCRSRRATRTCPGGPPSPCLVGRFRGDGRRRTRRYSLTRHGCPPWAWCWSSTAEEAPCGRPWARISSPGGNLVGVV
jgi:hypothetical protein